ncbi:hypothetical protein [Methanoculleus sp.]|uniref:hypothetical protein n=1 Tax=Methanoculleus sp. TaxID=90427 RepID=UPI0025F22E34|nr:hypothetical protein [Methanoculleus sp.]MCK9317036.1 hypothetical protein [Methanoculleus sp.]
MLGNLAITMLPVLIVMAPMYGGGALLIREVVRRTGRSWPGMIVLALAYAVLEEGIITQSLFNPGYLGENLLDYGFLPSPGIALPWTLYVLTLHTVWSISVPIALVETLFPERRTIPWLGRPGLVITGILFAAGSIAIAAATLSTEAFVAPVPQLAAAVVIIIALIVAAFSLPPALHRPASTRPAPNAWTVGAFALAAGSIFMLTTIFTLTLRLSPWWTPVALFLLLDAAVIAAVLSWSGRQGWGDRHRLALAGGALLTYAWYAFPQPSVFLGNSAIDLIGNAVFAAGAILLIAVAARRLQRADSAASLPA